jgi:acyl-homoserine lactone acylase PvdQ
MFMKRLYVQGRLSELFGEKTLSVDKFNRQLGLARGTKNRSFEGAGAEGELVQRCFEAYAEGVNEQVAQRTFMPFEFYLLR